MTALAEQLERIVGSQGLTTDPDELHPRLTEWRGAYEGRTSCMVRPASTDEVAAVAAVDEETAMEALDLIDLDLEELPMFLTSLTYIRHPTWPLIRHLTRYS